MYSQRGDLVGLMLSKISSPNAKKGDNSRKNGGLLHLERENGTVGVEGAELIKRLAEMLPGDEKTGLRIVSS